MPAEHQIRDLARRVALRAWAERGHAATFRCRDVATSIPRVAGVHVAIHPAGQPLRPSSGANARGAVPERGRGPELVTQRSLEGTPDGGRYLVPRGAIITDLAREEAWRRRIVLLAPGANIASIRADGRLRVVLGSDHGGFLLKLAAVEWVREFGHMAFDLGTHDENSVDYPDFAAAVAEAVSEGRADLGISIDAAGIGSAVVANKVPGVRAAMCHNLANAKNAREHNHANVLTLGGKTVSPKDAREIVRVFLATSEGNERHATRVRKIDAIESSYSRRKPKPDGGGAR